MAIFWFRRDLRLYDNMGLFQALSQHPRVLPIFIFDRNILDPLDKRDPRVGFIHAQLEAIHQSLEALGSALWTFYGTPLQAFEEVLRCYKVEAVFTNRDYEPAALERDRSIERFLADRAIGFHTYKDQCIFEEKEILTGAGKPYTVFTPYKRKWLECLEEWQLEPPATEAQFDSFLKLPPGSGLPSLASMEFEPSRIEIPAPVVDPSALANYHENRDFPDREAPSRLGIHLRFGTLSIRKLVRRAFQINQTWLAQLIWRDFFMQVLFNFPHVATHSFRREYDAITWRNDRQEFQRWCQGMTGFPMVDAGMRELNQTGHMHNRVRMITASFLCKHLLIDWRWGERYFAARLLDFDLAANNGNWQWAAGTGCDAAPYFRVFNPWIQAKKFDPNGTYAAKWVPELGTPSYPEPMVEHSFARTRALEVYKQGLALAAEKDN